MEKKLVNCESGQLIIDAMIADAAREVSIKTGAGFTECFDDICDYVNGSDWMLAEEDENGEIAIDVNYFSVFLAKYSRRLIEEILEDMKGEQ